MFSLFKGLLTSEKEILARIRDLTSNWKEDTTLARKYHPHP